MWYITLYLVNSRQLLVPVRGSRDLSSVVHGGLNRGCFPISTWSSRSVFSPEVLALFTWSSRSVSVLLKFSLCFFHVAERLASHYIMEDQFRAPLKPSVYHSTIVLREYNTSDRCCFSPEVLALFLQPVSPGAGFRPGVEGATERRAWRGLGGPAFVASFASFPPGLYCTHTHIFFTRMLMLSCGNHTLGGPALVTSFPSFPPGLSCTHTKEVN